MGKRIMLHGTKHLRTVILVLIAILLATGGAISCGESSQKQTDATPPTISWVSPAGITTSGATITWTTDEAATSQVEYGLTSSYGSATTLDTNLVIGHSVSLSGLSIGTRYHYRVKSKDASENEAVSEDHTFTTATSADTTPPVISAEDALDITTSGATITWTTDEAATSQVEYGLTASYGSATTLDTNLVTNHTMTLTGLTSGTTYLYRVRSKDAAENEAISGDETFTTSELPDITLPTATLSGQPTGVVSYNTADITVGGTDVVAYKYKLDSGTWGNETLVGTHITLSGLSDGTHTVYVIGKDMEGNWQAEGSATTVSWTVDTTPPVISVINASGITTSEATINWTTNEMATGQVEYGLTTSYGSSSVLYTSLVTSHNVSLSGLSASTPYHYRVKSKDVSQNEAVSEDHTFTTAQSTQSTLSVHFIDVGQGDSILIDFGNTEVLIDGGSSTPGVVGYLQNYVDGPLEVMVATHPHADHIGGLTAVLGTFDVQEVWYNGESSTSQTYSSFMNAVQAEGAEVHVARRGDVIGVGGLAFEVLNPVNTSGTTNNNSVVLELSYGQVDFLFEGDAEHEAEASMLSAGLIPDVEILKVGHHGSRTASSASFLAVAKPEVAVYMAGTGNSYGHPHPETISALHAIDATIYGTDINGTVVVSTDGQTYSMTTQR